LWWCDRMGACALVRFWRSTPPAFNSITRRTQKGLS
jgi:hypothetical protein